MYPKRESRHDEQDCESHYDSRHSADDDLKKNDIHFPQDRLYGRSTELAVLQDTYDHGIHDITIQLTKCPSESSLSTASIESSSRHRCKGRVRKRPGLRVVFIDGYSGVGKSALVDAFIATNNKRREDEKRDHMRFVSGKYDEQARSIEPFSAINQAMDRLGCDLVQCAECITKLQGLVAKSDFWGDLEVRLLLTIFPGLSPFFDKEGDCTGTTQETSSPFANVRNNMKQIVHVFTEFVRLLLKAASKREDEPSIIFFLDDLQWADLASLNLLESLLSNTSIIDSNLMFIGSYRSNEVSVDHILTKFIDDLKGEMLPIRQLSLQNLSINDLGLFIADTLEVQDQAEVHPLTKLIYERTLGNVYFCKQAIEELVRKNAIYYDVILFQWRFNLVDIDPDEVLEDNVIQMVQSKLKVLSTDLQEILTIASMIRSTIDISIVLEILRRKGRKDFDCTLLWTLLDQGVKENLLIHHDMSKGYSFAHDCVQQAARLALDNDECKNKLSVVIGTVLMEKANARYASAEHWMLFAAAEHLNNVPLPLVPDRFELARLNFQVGELCLAKASFEKARGMFQAAINSVSDSTAGKWPKEHFDFCLSLFNRYLETEFVLGNFLETQLAIEQVLANGKTIEQKLTALLTLIDLEVEANNQNYALGAQLNIELLNSMCNAGIPPKPSKVDTMYESMKIQMMVGRRGTIPALSELKPVQDNSVLKLYDKLCHLSILAQQDQLTLYVVFRAIRLALKRGLSPCLPKILTYFCTILRMNGRIQKAYSYARLVNQMQESLDDSLVEEYSVNQLVLYSGTLHLKEPFQDSIDTFLGNYRSLLTVGNIEFALSSAMHIPLLHIASGLPLNALLEPQLKLFAEKANEVNRPQHLAVFQSIRQLLKNLKGREQNPVELTGSIMNEEDVLGALEGNSRKMTIRDISILRLMLAYIFDDAKVMKQMLQRLESFPLNDRPIVRQHLRLTFCGLAALTLARDKATISKRMKRKYARLGKKIMREMRKLDGISSENVKPIFMCLKAVHKDTKVAYDKAIQACSEAQLLHLEALMNEKCGDWYAEKCPKDLESMKTYYSKALQLYQEWGATSKVCQLQKKCDDLDISVKIPMLSQYFRIHSGLTIASMNTSVNTSVNTPMNTSIHAITV